MTLSNFDWTDKDSVKWFVLLPTGHEGPYSFKDLIHMYQHKKISTNVKVWSEGLSEGISLAAAISNSEVTHVKTAELPPLPDEEDVPPLPLAEFEEEQPEPVLKTRRFYYSGLSVIFVIIFGILFFIFSSFIKNIEKIDISRLSKMSIKLHERILSENSFLGWSKELFFKEYLPDDHSHIWLVTSGFQSCELEASFRSLKDKLLTMGNEEVSFNSKGTLRNHIVEFSSFEFTQGSKLVPGLYEMDIRADKCKWDGFIPLLMNKFKSPDEEYVAKTKVILFSKGAEEFQKILSSVLDKKMKILDNEKNKNDFFWQDLRQKLDTLLAITLQVEQHFLDYLDKSPATLLKNRKSMIEKYARQFGSFLTSFVVENENYFKNLNSENSQIPMRSHYELIIRSSTEKIGLEAMKLIEDFQRLKTEPSQVKKQKMSDDVRKVFANLKAEINQKITQTSEDRSK